MELNREKCDEELGKSKLVVAKTRLVNETISKIEYYRGRILKVKKPAKRLRLLALVVLALAGLLNVLAAFGPDDLIPGRHFWLTPAQWSYVVLVLGAGVLAFDKYNGYSSSWMRFKSAEAELTRELERFELLWSLETIGLEDNDLDKTKLPDVHKLLKDFQAETSAITEKETTAWIAEFNSNLASLRSKMDSEFAKAKTAFEDEKRKQQQLKDSLGYLKLIIKNTEVFTDLKIRLGSDSIHETSGQLTKEFLFTVNPGIYELEVVGKSDGKSYTHKDFVEISTGENPDVTCLLKQ